MYFDKSTKNRIVVLQRLVLEEQQSSVNSNQSGGTDWEVNICEPHKHTLVRSFCICCLHFVVIVYRHSNTSCHWSKGEQDTMQSGGHS